MFECCLLLHGNSTLIGGRKPVQHFDAFMRQCDEVEVPCTIALLESFKIPVSNLERSS